MMMALRHEIFSAHPARRDNRRPVNEVVLFRRDRCIEGAVDNRIPGIAHKLPDCLRVSIGPRHFAEPPHQGCLVWSEVTGLEIKGRAEWRHGDVISNSNLKLSPR